MIKYLKNLTTSPKTSKVREATFGYDSKGNMISKALWLNTGGNPTITMTYDGYGNQKTLTDPMGHMTSIDYDPATNTYPIKVTAPQTADGRTHIVGYLYNYSFGTVRWKKDERGYETSTQYDPFGRVSQVDYPDGGQQIITYNDVIPPNRYTWTKVKESSGQTVDTYQYFDGLDRKTAIVTFGENAKRIDSTTHYDTMGRVDRAEGPYFYPRPSAYPYAQTAYDYRGRPTQVTTPDGTYGTVTSSYSYSGFATTITDPDSKQETETRDYLNRIIQVTEYADTGTQNTTYSYNAAGDLRQITDPVGNTITQTYDSLGRKIAMNDPDLGYWEYTYDANGNLLTEANQRTLASLAVEATEIDNTYDEMNRVKSETKIIEGAPAEYTTQYEYDLAGKPKKQTYPDNYKVTYAYYPGSGLLYTATGSDSEVYATCTLYEPTGKMGQINQGNGTATRYTYDAKSTWLMGIVTTDPTGNPANDIQNRAYTYSKAGDITRIVDNAPGRGITYNYTYDKLHRLTSENSGGVYPQIGYAYNGIGNITQKTVGTNTYAYTYDTAHRHAVKTITVNGTPYQYTYDEVGDMIGGPDFTNPANIATRAIAYYADNLPATIQHSAGGITDFVYDGLGNRVIKQVPGGGKTFYIGDHFELKDGVPTKYIFAGNLRVAKVTPSTHYYYHKDHLSSSSAMTDDNGAVVEMTEYRPFGDERDHAGEVVSDYKFTDQELDTETGLYNYDARHYDAVIGRFISADPTIPDTYDPQSLNRYSYARNNPLIRIDPTGLADKNLYESIREGIVVNRSLISATISGKIKERVTDLQQKQDLIRTDPRYQKEGGGPSGKNPPGPWCGQGSFAVNKATGVDITKFTSGEIPANTTANEMGKAAEKSNEKGTLMELSSGKTAQLLANRGFTVTASWINPGDMGHAATVRPTTEEYDPSKGPSISNVGRTNMITNVSIGFNVGGKGGAPSFEKIKYYYDPDQKFDKDKKDKE